MLTQSEIKSLFTYLDGKLYWNYREPYSRVEKTFNTKYGGKRAGYLHEKSCYWRINYNHIAYSEHVLIYILFNGYQPYRVDHKDNNKVNNKISNLRESDIYQNSWNCVKSSTNSSGFKGVSWHSSAKKWQGRLMCKGKSISADLYDSPDESFAALVVLRESFHKDFANNG